MLDASANHRADAELGKIAILPVRHTANKTSDLSDFWSLWREAEPMLMRRAMRILGWHEQDAEDAMSVCRLKAARSFHAAPASPQERGAWLYRILCNVCIDVHRERARAVKGACLASQGEARIVAPPQSGTVEERLHRRRALTILLREGAKLPQHLRRPFFLRVVLDWSYERIASHQGTNAVNARKRVQIARDTLAKVLRTQGLATE